jgi:alanyl-tRNA synthetase
VADLVNEQIQANLPVKTECMDLDSAKKSGAIALFDEKYEENVRVVSMGDFSKELCGGTHTAMTGDLGAFVLLSDESIASGIRRIEALVGKSAVEYLDEVFAEVGAARSLLKVGGSSNIADKAEQMLEHAKSLEKENEILKEKIVALESASLVEKARDVKGVPVICSKIDNYGAKELRVAIDNLKCRMQTYIIVLGSVSEDGKVSLIAAVSKDLISKIKAGDLIKEVAAYVGGKGGGRPDMAQAGGTNPEGLDKALSSVEHIVSERV